jgi:hypothetical protein
MIILGKREKTMKKIVAYILIAVMALNQMACANKTVSNENAEYGTRVVCKTPTTCRTVPNEPPSSSSGVTLADVGSALTVIVVLALIISAFAYPNGKCAGACPNGKPVGR